LEVGDSIVSEVDGMELMYIPAGSFMMGSEDGDADEQPVHEVYLDAYWMDRFEVTNAMFALCVQDEACNTQNIYADDGITYWDSSYENHPIYIHYWGDAVDYCAWAGRRLPTEAEWEHAARGASVFRYPWGDGVPTCRLANLSGCAEGTAEVGEHADGASPYGVEDMAGNVWEWVADWYDAEYYSRSPLENPTGPSDGELRVLRGGSWGMYENSVRSANRQYENPMNTYYLGIHYDIGFRCAMSAGE